MGKYRLVRTRVYETNKIQIVEFMWSTAHGWRGRILEKDSPGESARQRQFWSNRPHSNFIEEECLHDKRYKSERDGIVVFKCLKCGDEEVCNHENTMRTFRRDKLVQMCCRCFITVKKEE